MIGLIQKTLLDLVEVKGGPTAAAQVRAYAQVPEDHVYRIGDVYADVEFQRLLEGTCKVLNLSLTEVYEAFAEQFFRDATVRFGKWFSLAKNSHQFLIFQQTIHNTFASGVVDSHDRQAVRDKTSVDQISDRYIVTHYQSPNKLCGLYKALGAWIANYYGDKIEIVEEKCLHNGDSECEMHVKWLKFGSEGKSVKSQEPGSFA
jgi:Haem-NO-binding